ncbi:MAG: sigma-70 family RNA polymerase sigma factor [Clostridia bacterium]|nr:sigma-70 family RNA polymerase sigma factor [Clostridia bacterium]
MIAEERARELISAWRENHDEKAYEELYAGFKYLIDRYTWGSKGGKNGELAEELKMAASELLFSAVENMDLSRDTTVEAYFRTTIKQGLKNVYRDLNGDLPRNVKEVGPKVKSFINEYLSACGREPTVAEIAEKLDLSEELVMEAIEYGRPKISLSAPVGQDGEETELSDLIPDKNDDFERLSDEDFLRREMEKLSDIERQIIRLYYYEGMSEDKIGKILGMNQMAISRTIKKALAKMRADADKL